MQAAHDGAMPPYFRFLTIMAFYVFLQEQVRSLCSLCLIVKLLLVLLYFQFQFLFIGPFPSVRTV